MELSRRMFLHLGAAGGASFALGDRSLLWAQDREWPDNPYLKGNFGPIHKEFTTENLKVIGQIPKEVNGLFVRNGPNPQFPPKGEYHWFDGDGMLHGLYCHEGKARYSNRYVHTSGLLKERRAGKSLFGGLASGPPFKNAANTSIIKHHERLLALYEGGLPHEIDPENLSTKGEYDFNRKWRTSFTAHPKIDAKTGEFVFFGYRPFQKPFVMYGVADAKGNITHNTGLDFGRFVMMHEFAITANHTIFLDLPAVYSFRGPKFDLKAGARIGYLPRKGAQKDLRWVSIEPCWIWHVMNSYEKEGKIHIVAVRWKELNLDLSTASLTRWTIDPKSNTVTESKIDEAEMEFPRVNDAFTGHESKYGYVAVAQDGGVGFTTMAKYDFEKGTSESHIYGKGRVCGEGVFVPGPGGRAEDDGWIVNYVHDRATDKSEVVLVRADDIKASPVARILLPTRVPYGFHGTWLPGL